MDENKIEKQLRERLAELNERVERARDDLRQPADPDFAEQASEAEDDEMWEELERSGLQEIAQIQSALKRLEAGEYGVCATCGEDIQEKRLEAVPYAIQCIKCAKG